MKISQQGVNLIKQFEGLRLTAYYCPANVLTIGYGHTGPHVKPSLKITESQAEALLRGDLARFEAAVNKLVKTPLTQHQYDALVSFTFNCGEGALAKSSLLALINAGERSPELIAGKFLLWIKAAGKVNAGLVARRKREARYFNTGK